MTTRDQRRRERRRGERRIKRFDPRIWIGVGGVGLVFVAILIALMATSGDGDGGGTRYPQIGDHWHAQYSITICGDREPPFPVPSSGGVHTHGNDGLIHIHPQQPTEAGSNATLARFMAGTGGRLTNDLIRLPSGDEYRNGDQCPDGQEGRVFLRVNGLASAEIASYVPRDGDRVDMGLGPP
ncbi:MAG: hypothetical protein HYX93_01710 [Chloroflexi bacterium]|nr:hypothetical protein [Chloroflexota bacterium]